MTHAPRNLTCAVPLDEEHAHMVRAREEASSCARSRFSKSSKEDA